MIVPYIEVEVKLPRNGIAFDTFIRAIWDSSQASPPSKKSQRRLISTQNSLINNTSF